MTRLSIIAAAIAVLCAAIFGAATAASNTVQPTCFPSSSCEYGATDKAGHYYQYSLGGLCTAEGYKASNPTHQNYVLNICGIAPSPCLPATWTTKYEYGVAVQSWGATPNATCKTPSGNPARCTADCNVLGVGAPDFSLIDASDASKGVQLRYSAGTPSLSDPFWCPFNPATGKQYSRNITYVISCNPNVHGAKLVSVTQSNTNDCEYTADFESNAACPSTNHRL